MFLKPFIRSASARSSSSSSGSGLDLNNAVCTLLSIPGPRQYPIVGTLPSYWWPKYDKLRYNKGTWPMSSLHLIKVRFLVSTCFEKKMTAVICLLFYI